MKQDRFDLVLGFLVVGAAVVAAIGFAVFVLVVITLGTLELIEAVSKGLGG